MNQEDKELLLKDLCMRLPYGVHCCVFNFNKTIKEDNDIIYGIVSDNILSLKSDKNECYMYHQIKPYLRPMSSMTKEEEKEYNSFIIGQQPLDCDFSAYPIEYKILYEDDIDSYIDWLNAHHFDYRGLIEKDLAIAVTEENNPYED